jgi:hypothetical protein
MEASCISVQAYFYQNEGTSDAQQFLSRPIGQQVLYLYCSSNLQDLQRESLVGPVRTCRQPADRTYVSTGGVAGHRGAISNLNTRNMQVQRSKDFVRSDSSFPLTGVTPNVLHPLFKWTDTGKTVPHTSQISAYSSFVSATSRG